MLGNGGEYYTLVKTIIKVVAQVDKPFMTVRMGSLRLLV
jgi:hypothetical protein